MSATFVTIHSNSIHTVVSGEDGNIYIGAPSADPDGESIVEIPDSSLPIGHSFILMQQANGQGGSVLAQFDSDFVYDEHGIIGDGGGVHVDTGVQPGPACSIEVTKVTATKWYVNRRTGAWNN